MRLTWHRYSYYPYERDLAAREVASLLGQNDPREVDDGVELRGVVDSTPAVWLTYFSGTVNGVGFTPTLQARLEEAGRNGTKRQATRYSVHGLHEYKGKFNPQVVRALLNIFGIDAECRVLDPFCGSGTTLVECAHLGASGIGTDVNPLAILVARAKLQALRTPATRLKKLHQQLRKGLERRPKRHRSDDPRTDYLESWFDANVLREIEHARAAIEQAGAEATDVFLAIASNLLRDYSRQDPNDLRTRRRKSPLPKTPFRTAFLQAVSAFVERVDAAQSVVGIDLPLGQALCRDVAEITAQDLGGPVDAVVTSPPYAMALPYIDTQRLSLVWLGLCRPDEIRALEAELIGSRELRGRTRHTLTEELRENTSDLPIAQARFCLELHHALGLSDGFRRQAMPTLLYRYFKSMKASFKAVRTVTKSGGRYALIVGHNHTTIGGVRREIDTPAHLVGLALAEGWDLDELVPLQTYQRYGYHMNNAVAAETLILLRNS